MWGFTGRFSWSYSTLTQQPDRVHDALRDVNWSLFYRTSALSSNESVFHGIVFALGYGLYREIWRYVRLHSLSYLVRSLLTEGVREPDIQSIPDQGRWSESAMRPDYEPLMAATLGVSGTG